MDHRCIFKTRLTGLAGELYERRRFLSTWWDFDAIYRKREKLEKISRVLGGGGKGKDEAFCKFDL